MQYYKSKRFRVAVVMIVLVATGAVVVDAQRPESPTTLQVYLEKIYYVVQQIRTSVGDALTELGTIRGKVNDVSRDLNVVGADIAANVDSTPVRHEQTLTMPLVDSQLYYQFSVECDQPYELAAIYVEIDQAEYLEQQYLYFDIVSLVYFDGWGSYEVCNKEFLYPPEYFFYGITSEHHSGIEVISMAGAPARPVGAANTHFKVGMALGDPYEGWVYESDDELHITVIANAPASATLTVSS